MLGSKNEILYVGKAKNLRNRVSSYFNESAKNVKTQILVSHIRSFKFFITENETEAFVLENNLIKKHSPKYNIRLKDDKTYPYLEINFNHDFPRLVYTRKPKNKKGYKILGPFVHGSNIAEVLRTLNKAFLLRDCSDHEFKSRKEPCLLYQIKQCSAPCVGKVSKENYAKDLKLSTEVFEKNGKRVLSFLEREMLNYAEKEEFERAAFYRDWFNIIEEFVGIKKQKNVELSSSENIDLFAAVYGEKEWDIGVYIVREGRLIGSKNFNFLNDDRIDEKEDHLLDYIFQYYKLNENFIPNEIIVDCSEEKKKILSSAMSIGFNKKVKVLAPYKKIQSLYDLTLEQVRANQSIRFRSQDGLYYGLQKLQELLKLKERPILLECYDIAIFQGSSPTASQIVFDNGIADKKRYRYYHLKERPEGNNDFAMMKEVLIRRLEKDNYPDVFIVDGGKGQVSSFQEVLKEFDLNIPVVGIAKSKNNKEERLIIPGRLNPYILKKNPGLFRIVVQMRDEAHRFSRKLHHKSEKKKLIQSWILEVPGIGSITRDKILNNLEFGKNEVSKMSVEEICENLKVSSHIAKKIREYLN